MRSMIPLMLGLLLALPPAVVLARPDSPPGRAVAPRQAEAGLAEAVRRAERRSGGRVLSAERRLRDGRPWYRIKLLTPDGRVQVLWLEAR
ncbi:hypothetical protein QVG61_13095 [Thiohalobacter sp. IOR34]|uniref:PepSY domain-containing protein n=1 Tax=Thiohalobacter sp. IOR34 TaxID=3057176 RepID=UPI0025AFA13A|nr:hypothetical protein [Thiohalobacter sp. IOR34]WJW75406.1 hypothetical protein QVG61_13095 [Thiohalobacter sp. IOR34]